MTDIIECRWIEGATRLSVELARSTLENSWTESIQTKHAPVLRPNNFTSWKIHNRSEALWSPNDKSGHGSFIRVVTNWKQPKCPWIVLLNGIAKWYSNQKELLPHRMWMNLTDSLLSKRSQMQKNTYRMVPCLWSSRIGKIKMIEIGIAALWVGEVPWRRLETA